MDITLERAALAKALSTVDRIVERRQTIPILANVALYADGDSLRLKATDMGIEASTSAPAIVATPGQTTIPAALLSSIVAKLPEGAQITLATQANGQVALRSGRSNFKLGALPIEDFPDVPAAESEQSFTLPPKLLGEMIERTRFAISTEETRYYLNGIFLHLVDGGGAPKLRAVTTDGHRLARFEIPAPEGSAGMPGIILPRKAVGEFSRLAKDADEEIRLGISASKITVQSGSTRLVSRLIEGNFPDYERVIPRDNDKIAAVDAAELASAVDLVAAVASDRARPIRLALSAGRLDLTITDPDRGTSSHSLDADYDGAAVEIGFQSRYLADAIASVGGDTVEFKIADGGTPAILQSKGDNRLLVLILPLRI